MIIIVNTDYSTVHDTAMMSIDKLELERVMLLARDENINQTYRCVCVGSRSRKHVRV